ncbi:MAG: NUDIX hydrolase [Candidatus Rokubacteria bacterium]|nr:NUDIX hydrolase [Candidatus Rokubacteria bacterium]
MAATDGVGVRVMVRAAGGVVWRRRPDSGIEVLLVHRRARGDWSFPKGKVEPGETEEVCAVREVEEETSLTCRLGRELPSVRYRDERGRDKTVRYWTMEGEGRATARNEVDEVRWVSLETAGGALTYPLDREVLAAFAAMRSGPA